MALLICGVTLKESEPSEELQDWLGMESFAEVVRRSRFNCFRHVKRMSAACLFSAGWLEVKIEVIIEGSRSEIVAK